MVHQLAGPLEDQKRFLYSIASNNPFWYLCFCRTNSSKTHEVTVPEQFVLEAGPRDPPTLQTATYVHYLADSIRHATASN